MSLLLRIPNTKNMLQTGTNLPLGAPLPQSEQGERLPTTQRLHVAALPAIILYESRPTPHPRLLLASMASPSTPSRPYLIRYPTIQTNSSQQVIHPGASSLVRLIDWPPARRGEAVPFSEQFMYAGAMASSGHHQQHGSRGRWMYTGTHYACLLARFPYPGFALVAPCLRLTLPSPPSFMPSSPPVGRQGPRANQVILVALVTVTCIFFLSTCFLFSRSSSSLHSHEGSTQFVHLTEETGEGKEAQSASRGSMQQRKVQLFLQ